MSDDGEIHGRGEIGRKQPDTSNRVDRFLGRLVRLVFKTIWGAIKLVFKGLWRLVRPSKKAPPKER